MKAQVLIKPNTIENHPLHFQEVEIPQPGFGQVLIKNLVCGICRTDLHVVEGDLEFKMSPIIPGHQVVGEVIECGHGVNLRSGDRVGVAWLQGTCGKCRFCISHRENLCESALFTGWTAQGGFSEYMVASEKYIYPIPDCYSSQQVAPLLCGGIIGYRSLKLMRISDWSGRRIGIYGFGSAGHIVIQLLRAWGAEVYVCTRDKKHQDFAHDLGAIWTGGTIDVPPILLDGAIVFAPVGEIVPRALKALDRQGCLILSGIHMSPIPSFSYDILYGEREIKTVTNNTKQDGLEFLDHAVKIGIQTNVQTFSLREASDALYALKHDMINGTGVLII